MALIVETGTGSATAESYISVVDATAYHVARGGGDAWDLVDDKEAALRKATDYMTQQYRGRWTGQRVTVTQRLDWPRAWAPIEDAPSGYRDGSAYVASNIVPEEVKFACAILALQSNSGELAPNLAPAQSRVKVGEIEVTYDSNSPEYVRYRAVDLLLKMLISGSGATMKLIRT